MQIGLILLAGVLGAVVGAALVWQKYRDAEALVLALLSYMDYHEGVPTYKELSPYVRTALKGRIEIE